MSHTVNVTGVPRGGSGLAPPPPRLDIRNLIKKEKQFSLYIQALTAMMKANQDELLSFYSIAGVHGLPAKVWNNAKPPAGSWYCHHGVATFPTWHRPYMALFEQVLHDHAVKIAAKYKGDNKDEWKKAAQDLRAPYWDWASEAVPPPEVIELDKLNIVHSDGKKKAVDNPLLTYKFNPRPSFSSRDKTVRCPVPSNSTETNVQALKDSLQGRGPIAKLDWRTETYNMLTRTTTWSTMSNGVSKHGQGGLRDAVNSLESIHGDVHVIVGGGGQMGSVPVAGFDPIFWLHHVNIDRLLSLWEALHPGEWVPAPQSTQDLLPFWQDSDSYWISDATRSPEVLNYTYPEFVGLKSTNPNDRKKEIGRKVNSLYGPRDDPVLPKATTASTKPLVPGLAKPSLRAPSPAPEAAEGASAQHVAQHVLVDQSTQTQPEDRLDWTCRIRTKLNQFGISYTVLIFVGQPPEEEHEWRTCDEYVGSFAAFVNSSPEECENCQEQADVVVEGFVAFTEYLQRSDRVQSLEPETIVPFLKDQIHWRIQKIDGTVVPANEVQDLEVAVMSVPLSFSPEDQFFTLKEGSLPRHHPEITTDHEGGRKVSP